MLPSTKACRRALAAAIISGFTAVPAFADDPAGLQDIYVEDATGQSQVQLVAADEPAPPEPVVDPTDMPQPMPEAAPAPEATEAAPAPMPTCNCCTTPCCTKKKKEAATAAMKAAYKGVFYANDFSYLDDPCYDGPCFPGDNLKRLLGGRVDLGGEARVRYHSENNHRGLGLTGRDDDFWLTRIRLFGNARINQYFRFYGEWIYADSGGEVFGPRPIEENQGDIQNMFLDTQLTENFSFRFGRQELLLGAQRLVSPLDWANTRRTFDGIRGTYTGDTWTVDSWLVNPLNRDFKDVDSANDDVQFFGLYGARDTSLGQFEPYYIGLNNDTADFSYHTFGSRLVGSTDGGTLYELEGGFQVGENTSGSSHNAGFFTGGIGRKLSICTCCGEWNPVIWGWYDWASGEEDFNAVARGDNGFDHAFPLAHKYNGFMDLFGRRNLNDVNFQFITPILGPKVKFLLWYHYFFLDQRTTPYSVVMTPFNTANAAGSKDLGHEIDLLFNIALNPRSSALIGYSHFNAGDYFSTTPGVPTSADADFFYFQLQTRF